MQIGYAALCRPLVISGVGIDGHRCEGCLQRTWDWPVATHLEMLSQVVNATVVFEYHSYIMIHSVLLLAIGVSHKPVAPWTYHDDGENIGIERMVAYGRVSTLGAAGRVCDRHSPNVMPNIAVLQILKINASHMDLIPVLIRYKRLNNEYSSPVIQESGSI